MSYPSLPNYAYFTERLTEFSRLLHEYGADDAQIETLLAESGDVLAGVLAKLKALPICAKLSASEPNELEAIMSLRPEGPRRIWNAIDLPEYRERLAGAFLARMAGCTLGAIVEFWSVEGMEEWAAHIGDAFPPTDYWSRIKDEPAKRYGKSPCIDYTRDKLDGVPVDDDITYTQLGLLIAEDSPAGIDFTVEDVGKAWVKYLPYACTAEDVALKNLRAGISAEKAAEVDNPYEQWIGADIRSDPFGYMAPGYPEKAAKMAYSDAYISHRRNGIYGEMYFSAVISAAFTCNDPLDACRIGLSEIPMACTLANDIRWALDVCGSIHNYKEARAAVDKRFEGMSGVHTNLNACFVIFGLAIGGTDITRVIGETVAMGQDNDCTAATAGSIVGAVVGKKGIPEHWYKNFNNVCYSYIIGHPSFAIDDLLNRFEAQAIKALK